MTAVSGSLDPGAASGAAALSLKKKPSGAMEEIAPLTLKPL
jgi:hypothetical protein